MDIKITDNDEDSATLAAASVELVGGGASELVEACQTDLSPIIHLSADPMNMKAEHTILSTLQGEGLEESTNNVVVENCMTGQQDVIRLDLAAGSQELLRKITSQDAECQTILQELMDNLNEPEPVCDSSAATLSCLGTDSPQIAQEGIKNHSPLHASGDLVLDKPLSIGPLNIGSRTEAVINGRKCILIVDPHTGQLNAYPVADADDNVKKKRGRPRRVLKAGEELGGGVVVEGNVTGESQTDAAEGLLELYNTGPDGVRRSVRKRIRAKALDDYDVKHIPPTIKAILRNPADTVAMPKSIPSPQVPVKRGRGRPRRYPRAGEGNPTKIPAVIIPGPNGQTLMMAPIKGLQNLQAFQQQVKTLPSLAPQPGPPALQDIDRLDLLAAKHPDNSGDSTKVEAAEDMTGPSLRADTEAVQSLIASMSECPKEAGDGRQAEVLDNTGQQILMSTTTTPEGKATVLQLTSDVIDMYTKKEPVKLGLKATENDLEKLKCIKCNFQAYFPQQYQEHISIHGADVQHCKCCKYVSFDREEVLEHTRVFHPRCICNVCDFTAEHAYMIKRHSVRHNSEGFTCDICGKIYKDKYILKMHTKMVHMPADVLFECNTCDKKFTRKAHLKRHLRLHEDEKPHKCNLCDYKGTERSDLLKHELIHRDPEYLCDICGKQFRHVKNKELHVKRHRGQKDYKCGICDFYGYTFTDIRKHIERRHSEVNRFLTGYASGCERCGCSFKTAAQLEEHRSLCLEMTIERTLSITNSAGETSQALLRLPHSVQVNGQEINITVEEVPIEELEVDLEEHGITLTEDQFVQSVQDPQRSLEFDSTGLVRDEASLDQLVVTTAAETDTMLTVSQ